MKRRFQLSWTIVNAIGLSIGFLSFIQALMFYSYSLNFDLHWDFQAAENLPEDTNYLIKGLAIALPIFGLVYTSIQSLVLKNYLPSIWKWMAHGVVGFVIIVLMILPFASIWGHIPGPVEPFSIVFGGSVCTIIAVGILILFVLYQIGMNLSWALEVAIIGLVVGGSAGYFSSKHFEKEFKNIQ